MVYRVQRGGPPITEERLQRFEEKIGARLSDDYRGFLLEFNGGTPIGPAVFAVPGRRRNYTDVLQYLEAIDHENSSLNLENALSQLAGRIPDDAIPIAFCSCGDTVLLSVRGSRRGQVLMWNHEGEGDPDVNNVYVVAESFTEFVDGLYE